MTDEASLPWSTRFVYGTGHILNDLCAVLWFTYLLLFLEKVIGLDGVYAGVVLLSGQIADGLVTVPIGYLSDKDFNCWLCTKYGKRKTWHLFGTIGVLLNYPFLFLGCFGCNLGGPILHTIYLSWFSCIHNFAWAAAQVSHLALIPELSPSQDERTGLTAIRHSATVASNIAGYVLIWAIVGVGNEAESIGPESKSGFLYVLGILMAVGATTSIIFHIFIKSPSKGRSYNVEQVDNSTAENVHVEPMSVLDWLREPQTYQVAIVYLITRMFVNLTQMYLPFYLQETLKLPNSYVATIPLIIYVAGFATSTVMKYVNGKIGRKATFIAGCALGLASCIWIFFGSKDDNNYRNKQIYGVAVLMGAGGSTMLITSLSVTAELIGPNHESGAFIYGFMSLVEKVTNGIIIIGVQSLASSKPGGEEFYTQVLFYVCGGACLMGAIAMLSLVPFKIGRRYWKPKTTSNGTENVEIPAIHINGQKGTDD